LSQGLKLVTNVRELLTVVQGEGDLWSCPFGHKATNAALSAV